MDEIIEIETEFGTFQVETSGQKRDPIHEEFITRGGRESTRSVDKITKSFTSASDTIKAVGSSVVKSIKDITETPDEVSIEIGLKFSLATGFVVAKANSEGAMKVTMKWNNYNGQNK